MLKLLLLNLFYRGVATSVIFFNYLFCFLFIFHFISPVSAVATPLILWYCKLTLLQEILPSHTAVGQKLQCTKSALRI